MRLNRVPNRCSTFVAKNHEQRRKKSTEHAVVWQACKRQNVTERSEQIHSSVDFVFFSTHCSCECLCAVCVDVCVCESGGLYNVWSRPTWSYDFLAHVRSYVRTYNFLFIFFLACIWERERVQRVAYNCTMYAHSKLFVDDWKRKEADRKAIKKKTIRTLWTSAFCAYVCGFFLSCKRHILPDVMNYCAVLCVPQYSARPTSSIARHRPQAYSVFFLSFIRLTFVFAVRALAVA